jgi:RNase P protein component
MKLVSLGDDFVKRTMMTAAASGRSKIYQGISAVDMRSEFQRVYVFHVGRLSGAIECNDDRQADCDFGGRDRDDEEDEDLGVVAGHSIGNAKTRKRYERQVRRVQHQLERHENDNDVPTENDAGEPDREKHSADDEIMAKR